MNHPKRSDSSAVDAPEFETVAVEETQKVDPNVVIALQRHMAQIYNSGASVETPLPAPAPTRRKPKPSTRQLAETASAFAAALSSLAPQLQHEVKVALAEVHQRAGADGLPVDYTSDYLQRTLTDEAKNGRVSELLVEMRLPGFSKRITSAFVAESQPEGPP
jgi:hypothetical protein